MQDVGQGRNTVARQYTIANLTAFASYDSLSKSSASTWHLYMEDFNDDSALSLVRPLSKLALQYEDIDEELYDGMPTERCTISNSVSDINTVDIADGKLVRYVKMTPATGEVTATGASLNPTFDNSSGIVRLSNTCFVPMEWGRSESDKRTLDMQAGWLLGNPNSSVKITMRPCRPMAFIEDWLLKINCKAAMSFNTFPESEWNYGTIGITVNSGSKSFRFKRTNAGTVTPAGWVNFRDYVNVFTPDQNGDIIGEDTISTNITDYNLTDTNGLLLQGYQGSGKLNDDFEIVISILPNTYLYGTMMMFDVQMINPNKDMQKYFYPKEKEHVYNGVGINEEEIDVTLNNYGEFRNLNSFSDSNMNISEAFMPRYDYMLTRTLKILRQNAKKTGDIPAATVGSIYVPQMQLYNQTGYWSVVSCSLNMRDDKYRLTRIPIYQ